MTLDEIISSVSATLASGQIGTPVSLRTHVQLSSSRFDACRLLAMLLPLAERVFGTPPHRLMARKSAPADQVSVLCEYPGGQTWFATCGQGCTRQSSMQLLLFGNKGQVRLEGSE